MAGDVGCWDNGRQADQHCGIRPQIAVQAWPRTISTSRAVTTSHCIASHLPLATGPIHTTLIVYNLVTTPCSAGRRTRSHDHHPYLLTWI